MPTDENRLLIRQLQGKYAGLARREVHDTLPASPVVGDSVRFATAAMVTEHVYWDVWWDGTSWVFAGGPALWSPFSTTVASQTFSGTPFASLSMTGSQAGAALVMPAAGSYEVTIEGYVDTPSSLREVRIYVGDGTTLTDWFAGDTFDVAGANPRNITATVWLNAPTAGTTYQTRHASNVAGGTANYRACRFSLLPFWLT